MCHRYLAGQAKSGMKSDEFTWAGSASFQTSGRFMLAEVRNFHDIMKHDAKSNVHYIITDKYK